MAVPALSEHIALAIEEAILLGKLKPGERIVEADVAAEMGTSNGPVREALYQLEDLGLVASIPRRGAFVTQLTSRLVGEVYSVRALLEVAALRLTVHRLRDSDVERFEDAITRGEQVRPGPNGAAWSAAECDLCFHDISFELCGHRLLQQSWQKLRGQARLLLVVTGALHKASGDRPPTRNLGMRTVHVPIVEALRARDLDRAESALVHHLTEGERLILSRLSSSEEDQTSLVRDIFRKEGQDMDPSP